MALSPPLPETSKGTKTETLLPKRCAFADPTPAHRWQSPPAKFRGSALDWPHEFPAVVEFCCPVNHAMRQPPKTPVPGCRSSLTGDQNDEIHS